MEFYFALKAGAVVTCWHDVVVTKLPQNMNIQNTKTELNSTGEDLDNHSADTDDPAPASLWIIMLTKRGRLWIETFQS